MANTVAITDLTTSINLVYASTTQESYKMYYGAQMEALETQVLEHFSDYGPSRPIRATDPDRTFYFTMNVTQNSVDEDEIANNIILLKRWVDGADQQALRYQLTGDCDPIYVKVQLNNWTNATLHEVKWGWVDDSRSYYTEYKDMVTGESIAYQVHVMLRLQPYGQAENSITLRNRLLSSPHFVENHGGAGLCDGWNLLSTTSAGEITHNFSIWLIGGSSQHCDVSAAGEGIISDTIPNASATSASGYAWVYVVTGTVQVVLWDQTASTALQTKTVNTTNADKSAVGDGGNTWLRIPVSASGFTAGNDIRLAIQSSGGAANFYVDGCYVNLGTVTIPDAWSSYYQIKNRGDVDATNEDELNYLDIWGVPGDARALTQTYLDFTSSSAFSNTLYVGQVMDGILTAGLDIHWVDDNSFSPSGTNVTFSQPSDATRTEGQYRRATDNGGGIGLAIILYSPDGDNARRLFYNPKKILALVRASDASATPFYFTLSNSGGDLFVSETVYLSADSEWHYLDLGVINLKELLPLDPPDTGTPDDLDLEISCNIGTPSATADFDAVLFLPVSDEYLITKNQYTNGYLNNDIYIRGSQQDVVDSVNGYRNIRLGSLWTIPAGNIMTRRVFAIEATGGSSSLATAAITTITVTPRTRHLLGTT